MRVEIGNVHKALSWVGRTMRVRNFDISSRKMTSSYHNFRTPSFNSDEFKNKDTVENGQWQWISKGLCFSFAIYHYIVIYFKPIFYTLSSENKIRFSEVFGSFSYDALKLNTYTIFGPCSSFFPLKLQKPYSSVKLSDVKKCNNVLNWS